MANHKSVAATGKPAVRDQGHFVAQALAHNRPGRTEHFPHAGSTFWPLVTNDKDVSGHDDTSEDSLQGFFF